MVLGTKDTKIKGRVLLKDVSWEGKTDKWTGTFTEAQGRKRTTYLCKIRHYWCLPRLYPQLYIIITPLVSSSVLIKASTSTEKAANPTLPRDTFHTKSLPLSLGQANLSVFYSVLLVPIPTHTFQYWMVMATYIFPGKKSWHHLWLFPLTLTKTVHSNLQKVFFSIFTITTVIYTINSKSY